MSWIGVVVLVAALVVAAAVSWWLRTRSGAVRPVADPAAGPASTEPAAGRVAAPAEQAPATGPRAVLEGLGVRPDEADLTVVQFSTAFCAPCRATKARLEQLRGAHPGLAVVHVDAESELAAVRALDVRRTPTLFYLDRTGALLGRSSGAPRPDELAALVEAHAGPAVRPGTSSSEGVS